MPFEVKSLYAWMLSDKPTNTPVVSAPKSIPVTPTISPVPMENSTVDEELRKKITSEFMSNIAPEVANFLAGFAEMEGDESTRFKNALRSWKRESKKDIKVLKTLAETITTSITKIADTFNQELQLARKEVATLRQNALEFDTKISEAQKQILQYNTQKEQVLNVANEKESEVNATAARFNTALFSIQTDVEGQKNKLLGYIDDMTLQKGPK